MLNHSTTGFSLKRVSMAERHAGQARHAEISTHTYVHVRTRPYVWRVLTYSHDVKTH